MAAETGGVKVGGIYYDLTIDDKGFVQAVQRADQSISGLEKKFGSAVKSSEMLAKALAGIGAAALGIITAATLTAARTETMGVAMNAVARATGNSTKELAEQEKKLRSQGIATQEARGILTKFMQAQLDVADASKIARVAQDAAVIAGINSSEAADLITQGIVKRNIVLLESAGITIMAQDAYEKYGAEIGKNASDLTVAEQQQAFMNATLEKGALITGTYEAAMGTAGKQLTSMPRYIQDAANSIGEFFLPAFGELIKATNTFLQMITVENITAFAKELSKYTPILAGIAGAIIFALLPAFGALAAAIWTAVGPLIPFAIAGAILGVIIGTIIENTIGWGKAFEYLQMILGGVTEAVIQVGYYILWLMGLVSAVVSAILGFFGYTKQAGVEAHEEVAVAAEDSADSQVKSAKDANDEQVGGAKKKTKDLKKQLKEEEDDFAASMAKRKAAFEENLAQIIWAHQDKIKSLESQIGDENTSFADSTKERAEEFADSMEDFKDAHEDKVENIEKQIDKEKLKGRKADQDRILELQESLDEENTAYDEQVVEKEEKQAKEDAKLLARHEKQIADYTAELQAERDILNAHQAEVDSVKGKAREDDIARLVRQHQEDEMEAQKAHEKKMVDIVENSKKEGAAGGAAFNAPQIAASKDLKSFLEKNTKEAMANVVKEVQTQAFEAGRQYVKQFIDGLIASAREVGSKGLGLLSAANPIFGVLGSMLSTSPGWDYNKSISSNLFGGNASGTQNFQGGWTRVGEAGEELVNLPSGSKIYPSGQSQQMMSQGGQSVYVNVENMNSQLDIDSTSRELGYAVQTASR